MNSFDVAESMTVSKGLMYTFNGRLIWEDGKAGRVLPGVSLALVVAFLLLPQPVSKINNTQNGKWNFIAAKLLFRTGNQLFFLCRLSECQQKSEPTELKHL